MQRASHGVGFAKEHAWSQSAFGKHRGKPGPGAGTRQTAKLLVGMAGGQRGERWSWGGMDGLHVRGVRAFIPRERRTGLSCCRRKGSFLKWDPGAKPPRPSVSLWGPEQGVAGGLSRVSIALALRALLRSGTNFGPCHAQGD